MILFKTTALDNGFNENSQDSYSLMASATVDWMLVGFRGHYKLKTILRGKCHTSELSSVYSSAVYIHIYNVNICCFKGSD